MRSDNVQSEKGRLNVPDSEEQVFNQLFREYYAPLTWFAQSILGDMESAKDLVEDSFVKLWERRGILSRPGSIKSYLYTTVHNACIDFLRKEKRKSAYETEIQSLESTEERPVIYQIIAAETLQHVFQALKVLPPGCSLVFKMYYLQGRQLNEIASQLDLSLSTVKSQKSRAIELLRKRVFY